MPPRVVEPQIISRHLHIVIIWGDPPLAPLDSLDGELEMESGAEQSGYFTVLHANATSCCRQSQQRKQRKRRVEWEGERGKATHAARTCQKTFWKPSIGRNNNDRWQSNGGRWRETGDMGWCEMGWGTWDEGDRSTHVHTEQGSVSNWLSHQVVDMYVKVLLHPL